MYELIKISEHDYYIDCPAKIGISEIADSHAVTIDSGSDKDTGKKVLRHIEALGLTLSAVFTTHAHADHIGGCRLIQDRTGCKVYASDMECDVVNHTLFEPAVLYGANPLPELTHKFLMAQECKAEKLTGAVLPDGMKAVDLSGHSFGMTGFLTQDGNLFIGDAVSSEEALKKYGISYTWDIKACLASLEKLKDTPAKLFIPAHAPVTDNIAPLAQMNIDAVNTAAEKITALCSQPVSFDTLLQNVFTEYALTMNAVQYALIGSTVRSYLTYLYTKGIVRFFFDNNLMLWEKI